MSVVRQEFGPTLPELLGPRVRAWPRPARWALAATCAVVVAGIAWLLLTRGGGERTVVRTPIEFNLSYAPPLHRTAPRPGEDRRAADLRKARHARLAQRGAPADGRAARPARRAVAHDAHRGLGRRERRAEAAAALVPLRDAGPLRPHRGSPHNDVTRRTGQRL